MLESVLNACCHALVTGSLWSRVYSICLLEFCDKYCIHTSWCVDATEEISSVGCAANCQCRISTNSVNFLISIL